MLKVFKIDLEKENVNFELENLSEGNLLLIGGGNQVEIKAGGIEILTGKQINDQFGVVIQSLVDDDKLSVSELSEDAPPEEPQDGDAPVISDGENPVVKKADPSFKANVKALQAEYKNPETTAERKEEIKKEINALKKQKASSKK